MNNNNENRICQNCKNDFVIEPDDFSFYEKIKVPPPTFCPECRMQRRLTFRNERSLNKRLCDHCGEMIISIYSEKNPLNVFCQKCWWSDEWDSLSSSIKYNFSENFFIQFKNLYKRVPQMSLFNVQSVNSDYCNFTGDNKNSYLIFGGKSNENIAYATNSSFSKESFDFSSSSKLELCYENIQCENSNRLFFSKDCDNCVDSYFLYDCKNCMNCFGCTNLRNKQYCLFNKQLDKDKYTKSIESLNLGSFLSINEVKKEFQSLYNKSIHRFSHFINAAGCTGNNIRNAKNCQNCFDILGSDSENNKYTSYIVVCGKDCYDNYGMPKAERVYETLAIGFESNDNLDYRFGIFIKGSGDISYSINCSGSSNLFACIGLRSKQYCILNKQYTKEEYEKLAPKIIKHMNDMPYIDSKGRVYKYGEFFPPELSPFAYNETIAQEYFPLTKEQAISQGYKWKDKEKRNYSIDIKNKDIPDNIKDIDKTIINKIIECEHKDCNHQCTEAFKIIPEELQFYQRMNLPLPRLCPNCRHYERLSQRNPMKLWHRQCMCEQANHQHKNRCQTEFETSYSPERLEIIYCEKCYQKEIY